ncbi:MAG TPA: MOSC domain-containing protein [Clostridiales bacterium]|nr:MOSC domain-containing protein [Clostridiales bacterium]
MNKQGKVIAVNTSKEKGVVKTPVESIRLIVDAGVEGDAHAAPGNRQVSLLAQESVDRMKERTGADNLCVGIFAENITTEGLELFSIPIGTRIKIGEALTELSQIGKECHVGCAIMQQVGQCIMPKEGVFVRVLEPGVVKAGDIIEILD